MTELSPLEKLRHFVNAAHNYAAIRWNCTITIIQEYKDDNYVTVGFYGSVDDPEKDDPVMICMLRYIEYDVLFNCNFCVHRNNGMHALIKDPSDLSRLMFA